MKGPRKSSSLLTGVKFFFESFFEGIQYVFKKLITITGMLFALASVFGATQVYEHLFKGAPVAAPEETTSIAEDAKNSLNSAATTDLARAPASAFTTIGQSNGSSRGSSGSSNGNDTSPAFTESIEDNAGRQPQSIGAANGGGRFSSNFIQDSQAPAPNGKPPGPMKNPAGPDADANAGGIPLVGNLPSPSPTPQGPTGSSGIAPTGQIGSSFTSSAQTSAIISGGGISKSAQLMVQSQIGEIPSPLIQKGSQLQIINGLTGTQN